jgi:hypothetical protein
MNRTINVNAKASIVFFSIRDYYQKTKEIGRVPLAVGHRLGPCALCGALRVAGHILLYARGDTSIDATELTTLLG